MKLIVVSALISATLILTACGGPRHRSTGPVDGAPNVVLSPHQIQNPVPRAEPKSRGGNRSPYTVFGKQYHVLDSAEGFRQRGTASWYGTKFHGRPTANGERYDMYKMTAAHKNLPLPTYVRVRRVDNNKSIIVRVNDRGPFHGKRVIDLSYAAAAKLGMLGTGTTQVEVTTVTAPLAHTATAPSALRTTANPSTLSNNQQQPTSSTPVTTTLASAGGLSSCHYLQVGAFSQLDAAQNLQSQLLGKVGEDIVIHPGDTQNALYRVKIGTLHSADQTSAVQEALASLNMSDYHRVSCLR